MKSMEIAMRDIAPVALHKGPKQLMGKVGNGMVIIGCITRWFVSSYWCDCLYMCVRQ